MKALVLSSLLLLASLPLLPGETLEDYTPLLDNSPFLSKAFKDKLAHGKATGMNVYNFIGYTKIDDKWRLCFIHSKEGTAVWAGVGDQIGDFTVTRFDPFINAVTLERGGVSNTITMDKPKD